MRNLALVPARSGSKGLPDKNIKLLNGIPLMGHTILTARKSNCFQTIHVSTDSVHYANIAKDFGADVPFLRSAEASSDASSSAMVIQEVLHRYKMVDQVFDTVTLLQPTSPLRTVEDIWNVFSLFEKMGANSVISVCEVEHSPLWTNTLPADRSLENFIHQEVVNCPRQNLETYYRINGACYLSKVSTFLETESWFGSKSYAYIMPQERSIDIDSAIDFKIAEVLLRELTRV